MCARPLILIDEHIPYIKGVLESRAHTRYLPGEAIGPRDLCGVEALLVRTRTRCDARLFALHAPAFVGTATIGTDHIDLDYCAQSGISVASAPGCNAWGVVQYVLTVLLDWEKRSGQPLAGKTLGIIGVGQVGGRLARLAPQLGLRVLCNDPPRAAVEGPQGFTELAELLVQAHFVSLHVPLTPRSRGLVDAAFLQALRPGTGLINTARGEVVDPDALLAARARLGLLALDVWPHEPHISPALLAAATLGTPHIAGYSIEGKQRGTQMVVQALARHFGWKELYDFAPPASAPYPLPQGLERREAALALFPLEEADRALREDPAAFERLRSQYPLRHDLSGCTPPLFDLQDNT